MRRFFTFIFITFIAIGFVSGQAFDLGSQLTNGITTGGCQSSCVTAGYCSPSANGNHTVNTAIGTISIPSNFYLQITIISNICGTEYGLDNGDYIDVNGVRTVNGFGNMNVNYSGCFHNQTSLDYSLPVALTVNRRDETVNVSYSISATNPGGNCNSAIILPVEFAKFTATNKGTTNLIDFTTASEINNDYFTIERASNGGGFEAIGTIKGAGDSKAAINYTYADAKPSAGINHYRIMQTDYDGKYSYSAVKSVRNNLDGKLVITPRTTEGRLSILTDLEHYDIQVYDLSGQEVYKSSNHSSDLEINIDNVRAGIYFVKITNGYTTEVTKIVKI